MKTRIKRMSPHQNAKVMSILMAVSSLIFLLPMVLIMSLAGPQYDQQGNAVDFPVLALLILPFVYLVFGYISVAIGCLIYNFIAVRTGGIEFEMLTQED